MWIPIIVITYLLNATATVIDKFLLSKKIPNPAVYTFFISILSLLGIVLAPFGFHWTSGLANIFALLTGVVFVFSYFFMFKALGGNEASRVTPFMGGLQPIFVFILAWIFLAEKLSGWGLLAFILLIIGTFILSWQKESSEKKQASSRRSYLYALIATLLFAVAYTMNKFVFNEQGFITGFVMVRIGTALGALLLLLKPQNVRDIIKEISQPKKKSGWLFIIGQACGAASFILFSYAISIYKSVAIINASRGLEYVFLLIIVLILSRKYPKILKEKMTPLVITQKITAIVFIIIGLAVLAFA